MDVLPPRGRGPVPGLRGPVLAGDSFCEACGRSARSARLTLLRRPRRGRGRLTASGAACASPPAATTRSSTRRRHGGRDRQGPAPQPQRGRHGAAVHGHADRRSSSATAWAARRARTRRRRPRWRRPRRPGQGLSSRGGVRPGRAGPWASWPLRWTTPRLHLCLGGRRRRPDHARLGGRLPRVLAVHRHPAHQDQLVRRHPTRRDRPFHRRRRSIPAFRRCRPGDRLPTMPDRSMPASRPMPGRSRPRRAPTPGRSGSFRPPVSGSP